jgi:hypothetical protein
VIGKHTDEAFSLLPDGGKKHELSDCDAEVLRLQFERRS